MLKYDNLHNFDQNIIIYRPTLTADHKTQTKTTFYFYYQIPIGTNME